MKPVIQVENLRKKYLIKHQAGGTHYQTLRETLASLPKRLLSERNSVSQEEFWALDDVSFDVMQGERIGIIGRNGAGKSTLLKLLSRITKPTTGRITLRGRVASLLEVGTGFHPELTGRENIFLNGAILGMPRQEIQYKFDEIVDFAGVERFLDTPIKRYSSGMYVRLAFAVAAHLEPEILIVDEVLAVGDAEFQRKCLGKMEEVSNSEGRTVLFVSHNMSSISALCSSALLLERGKISLAGEVGACIHAHLHSSHMHEKKVEWISEKNDEFETILFHRCAVVDSNGNVIDSSVSQMDDVFILVEFSLRETDPSLKIGYYLYAQDERVLFVSFHTDIQGNVSLAAGDRRLYSKIPLRILNDGNYSIEIISGIHNVKWFFSPMQETTPRLFFKVQSIRANPLWTSVREGDFAPKLEWFSA